MREGEQWTGPGTEGMGRDGGHRALGWWLRFSYITETETTYPRTVNFSWSALVFSA